MIKTLWQEKLRQLHIAYRRLCFLAAAWFGVGYVPKASGTFGSLAAFPFIFAVIFYGGFWGLLIFVLATYFIGVAASRQVLKFTAHDPSLIVIDEVCGQAVTFLGIAWTLQGNVNAYIWIAYLAGFALFRLFDITKPSIIGKVDRNMENATGVMLDDVLAGVFAAVILSLGWLGYFLLYLNQTPAA